MCGICGIINFGKEPVRSEQIETMMARMKHRGPDDEGLFIDQNVGLGHVRLSIIDLSDAGHQPMFSEDGRYCIIYNGEVYNYIELRNRLRLKYNFKSHTDTEVVLYSFVEWGSECLDKFNGMWAFAIYDKCARRIFISRDRYGIKPFYYCLTKDRFAFASEIPPLLTLLPSKPSPDNQSIFDFLVFNRTDQTERTFFKEIKKLPHGHVLSIDLQSSASNHASIKKWYDLRERVSNSTGLSQPEEYRELFSSAIALRLRSDVPVGVCLSGGLDSSSIVSILIEKFNKWDLNTFSAVYEPGEHGDESAYISLFASKLKNMHFSRPSAQTLLNDIDILMGAYAEPIASTGFYPQFKLMELAKSHVVVILDGQGADEELAGYHYFFGNYFRELLTNFRFVRLLSEIFHYTKKHRSFYGYKTLLYFLIPKNLRVGFMAMQKGYIANQFYHKYASRTEISEELYGSASLKDALYRHFERKLEHLLKWEDQSSMFFSLEARTPFLDYRLVEKILAVDSYLVIHKGMTKHILREWMKGILPETIRQRTDKIGFGTPQDEWFRARGFREYMNDLFSSQSFQKRQIWNFPSLQRKYKLHLAGKENNGKEIWKCIHMENWYRTYID